MATSGSARTIDASRPLQRAVAIAKSDATIIPVTRCIYVGVTGDLVVTMADQTGPITFKAAAVGYHWLQVRQVLAATAATDMLALY